MKLLATPARRLLLISTFNLNLGFILIIRRALRLSRPIVPHPIAPET